MFKASGVLNEHSPGFAVQSFQKLTVFKTTFQRHHQLPRRNSCKLVVFSVVMNPALESSHTRYEI